jgi:hypothetical protein
VRVLPASGEQLRVVEKTQTLSVLKALGYFPPAGASVEEQEEAIAACEQLNAEWRAWDEAYRLRWRLRHRPQGMTDQDRQAL